MADTDRHLQKLPQKSYAVKPGDAVGGLIYVMDKPIGIEEGMVGIPIDSEPYQRFLGEVSVSELLKNKKKRRLLFQDYMKTLGIRSDDRFATKIGKLINDGNQVYMVKQDGEMIFGGTAPSRRRILKADFGKRLFQPLLHPAAIIATLGLSIPIFWIAIGSYRGFTIARNRVAKANLDAIVETLATKAATIRGFPSQEIDTIEGTYPGDTPKIATIVTWKKGCRDLSGKLAGGKGKWDNVIVMWDKKNGLPIKIDDNGYLIEVKEKDDKNKPVSYQKISPDGQITPATKKEYQRAKMMSEDKIKGLGESLLSFISMGDRDGIGGKGQNKAVIPLDPPQDKFTYELFGIDFGKSYKAENPIVDSLQDNFSFNNPRGFQTMFRNIITLYDNPLREKMKGIYLLQALRGKMDPLLKDKIITDYRDAGDEFFAKKLEGYPESVGGINADLDLITAEISKYEQMLHDKATKKKAKNQYDFFVKKLTEIYYFADSTDSKILKIFEKRNNLTPKQIDLLDNIEKLTARNASTLSADNSVLLNHIHVKRVDRVPWQITPGQNGYFTLRCEPTPSDDKEILRIRNLLTKINIPGFEEVNGTLTFEVTPQIFEQLQNNLTEEAVAAARNLPYRTAQEKDRVFRLLTERKKKAQTDILLDEDETLLTVFTPEPTPDLTPTIEQKNKDERIGFFFSGPLSKKLEKPESFFNQTLTDLNTLMAYLDREKHKHNNVAEVKKTTNSSGASSVDMTFKKLDTNSKPKAFAENGSPDSINFSTTADLSEEDFLFVANEIAAIAVGMANPGAEFDLTQVPDDKRAILEEAFLKAIKEAVRVDNRFTEKTKPVIKSQDDKPRFQLS